MQQFDEMQFGTGCIPSKKDIRDYRLNKKVCKATNLPIEFSVEHSPIKNQGNVGSCVAHSVTEVLEQIGGNKVPYSTAWIYGYRPFGYLQGEGMMTSQALKTTTKVGCIKYYDCPGNYEMPAAKEYITKKLDHYKELANRDKATTYARLYSTTEIKEAIYKTGKPVIVCILVNGLRLDENYIAQKPTSLGGGHAVVCYGWNERGLLIQNSWGERWGNKGCFILPYNYGFTEAWVLTKEDGITTKPTGFAIREALVGIAKAFVELINKIFKKK